MDFLSKINACLLTVLPIIIFAAGIFVLIRLRFFFVAHPFATFRGMLAGGAGENSPLRVLSVSLAGTLGVGNIVGVAVAISLGGIGSVFWMWISALVSMVLKYAEIVLAMRYRSYSEGGCKGGPMYYMARGIGGRLGRVLATVFCGVGVLASFCLGNIVQVSAAADSAERTFGLPKIIYGIIFAVLCALVIFGGFKKISSFTVVVMPLVCLIYIVLAMRIILLNLGSLPRIFSDIMQAAFTPVSGVSGIFGYLISGAVRHGTAKGTFSHEAGSGTAPMSHAQSSEQSAAKQGLYGIFEVFFDTIVICTMTALVIIISGFADISLGSMDIVISAFEKYYGAFSGYIFTFSMAIFAFSTVICWSYYGQCMLGYFTEKKAPVAVYLALYCLCAVAGAVMRQGLIWELADLAVAVMTSINLASVLMLTDEVALETAVFILPRLAAKCFSAAGAEEKRMAKKKA